MKPASDGTERENADMVRLLKEACGGNPNMTPEAAAVMVRFIIAELAKLAAREEGAGGVKPEWGTRKQVGIIYDMTPERADAYLIAWAAAGKVRVIAPVDPLNGKKGYRRYNLADVAACMAARQ